MNLVTPKAGAKHKLVLNKPASGLFKIKNDKKISHLKNKKSSCLDFRQPSLLLFSNLSFPTVVSL